MKRGRLVIGVVAAAVLLIGWWASRGSGPPALSVSRDWHHVQGAQVRVESLTMAHARPVGVTGPPPSWLQPLMLRSPAVDRFWGRTHTKYEEAPSGALWVLVDATILPTGPIAMSPPDLQVRLDYGEYTIGVLNRSLTTQLDGTITVSWWGMVTEGPVPRALEILVKDEWLPLQLTHR